MKGSVAPFQLLHWKPTFFDKYFCFGTMLVTLGLWSNVSLLSNFFTLYILTSQCSDVKASSKCLNLMSLLPISALRVRSNPGGVRKSSYKIKVARYFEVGRNMECNSAHSAVLHFSSAVSKDL